MGAFWELAVPRRGPEQDKRELAFQVAQWMRRYPQWEADEKLAAKVRKVDDTLKDLHAFFSDRMSQLEDGPQKQVLKSIIQFLYERGKALSE